jgi:hypothetical protein
MLIILVYKLIKLTFTGLIDVTCNPHDLLKHMLSQHHPQMAANLFQLSHFAENKFAMTEASVLRVN